jgi:serine protein kinase
MHEEPLHLIPHELRESVYKEYGIYIEGDLCPACRQMLQDQHGGRMEDVIVQRIAFSEKNRIGIGTFTPSDPKSQDISELTGSVDLSTIGHYGSESDPRAYRFDGELNVANRGLMEFIEMLKCDEKFLYGLLTLSQEQDFIKTLLATDVTSTVTLRLHTGRLPESGSGGPSEFGDGLYIRRLAPHRREHLVVSHSSTD